MEPAVIVTTAILLTLVVGLVVQTAVSYVKKAKKSKKPAKEQRKRPESNKENVVPFSTSFGAPSCTTSYEASSGGQTKITEQSHYQQIKSSVIRSESPAAPPTVLKHETTKTETRTSGEKLLPLCVEAFQESVFSPISGSSKTQQQEVAEHTSYQQFQSSAASSDQSRTQFSPLRSETTETQTKSSAEKLLPVCIEAFQESVLSPISGIKKTKTQEVTEHSNYQQFQSSMVNSGQSQTRFSPLSYETTETEAKSAAQKLIPVCLEAFQDSVLSPISGIKKTKKQEVIENSHYEDNLSNVNHSATPPLSPDSPRIWMSVSETRSSPAEKLLPMCVEAFQDSVLSPISSISKTKHQEVVEHSQHQQIKSSSVRPVSPAIYRSSPKPWSPTTQSPVMKKVLPLCVEAFQDSIQSPISGISKTKRQEVLVQSNYQSSASSVSSLVRCISPKPWTAPDTEMKTTATETAQPQDMVTETSYRQQSHSTMSHSMASSKPSMPQIQAKPSVQKLLPVCVEAFQDSVLSPISGIKKTKTHEIQSNVVRSATPPVSTVSPKPWKSETNARPLAAEKLLPVCVEAFQDCVLSPISGISKTKKLEIQSGVARSPTPPVPNTVPKPWKSELQAGSPVAAKFLPLCVEAFQDSVLSPISGIPKTKLQEISSSPIRSVTPPVLSTTPKPWKPETQASAEKLLPLCVEAFQDSVLSPISGIPKPMKQEPIMPVASTAQEPHSVGEKLLPLCVEAFQDSVLSPISGIGKTKKDEVIEPAIAEPPAQSSAGEKLLPLCVEAFQDSVLSPISGIGKTRNQEVTAPSTTEVQAQPLVGEKLLPLCVEAFQDSVLSPISGIAKTKNKEVVATESQAQPSVGEKLLPLCVEAFQDSVLSPISGINKTKSQEEDVSQIQSSAGEKLLPLCVEAFQDSVLSPISGISKTKNNEVTEHQVAETHPKPSPGEALLPLCVEAFQDSVLSPISGISKTKTDQEVASIPNDNEAKSSSGQQLLPLCVEAFQDCVLSPISGISKTKSTEITDHLQDTRSTAIHSETLSSSQKPEMRDAQKLIPVCVEAFRDSVMSPISGISKTKTHEISQDGRKTEKTTTETIQETKGSCQTTILRKEKESVVRDSFVTGNRPIFQATPLSAIMSQPSTVKTTKFESKSSETKQNVWQPTGAVAGKIKEYSSSQLAGVVNKPVAPVSESVISRNVYQQSEIQSSTLPRRNEYDSGTSSGAFTSPEPPLMPSRPFPAAPVSKPTFQNFNTTPKTWNEAKRSDVSQPSGFKPVRPPTHYTK